MDLNFYEKIVDGWERTETVNGVPYFTNHKTERTSWDHPYWTNIVEGLKEHDSVKYAAYRSALKIRQLQKQLHFDKVGLAAVRTQFEAFGHTPGTWESIHCDDLLTLLLNIYKDSPASYSTPEEPEMLADITLNLLLNLFDSNKMGFVKVMSAKFILVILSGATLTEKYKFFYQELHDPSTYISSQALTTFLEAIMKVPDFLNESVAFGRTPEPAVTSCCQMGQEAGGITEDVFYRWLQKEPQTIVWFPTFHRVVTTETVTHDVKCSICKMYPITGFRYKCLKCFNVDLCQNCFFTGQTRKKHKSKHPIQEYCMNATTKDDTTDFMKTLRNNLSRKQRRKSQLKYLPVEADGQYTNLAWSPGREEPESDIHRQISSRARQLADVESSEHGSDNSTPSSVYNFTEETTLSPKNDGLQPQRDELNAIIQQLEEENRALYEQLATMKEFSDTESVTSDNRVPGGHSQLAPGSNQEPSSIKTSMPLPMREPLPSEITPIYLSVPIIQVNGSHLDRWITSPPPHASSPLPGSVFRHPDFSTPDTCASPISQQSPPREKTLGSSIDDLDASPSMFSLPSPTKSHDDFQAEEAELAAIVNNAKNMFPSDLSYSDYPSHAVETDDDMIKAANSVQVAMSEFVSRAVRVNH